MENITSSMIFWGLVYLSVLIVFLITVYEAAKNRGRSAGWWTFLAIFATPFLCLFTLYVLGETIEKRKERLVWEERLKMWSRNEDYSAVSNTTSDEKYPVNSYVVETKTGKQFRVLEVDCVRQMYFCVSDSNMSKKAFLENEIELCA